MANANRIRKALTFKTKKVVARHRVARRRALDIVAREMQAKLKKVTSKPGTRKVRSKPGQAPRLQTGNLNDSITVERKGLGLQARAPLYGFFLDGGTTNIKKRPWFFKNIHAKAARARWMKRINKLQRQFLK